MTFDSYNLHISPHVSFVADNCVKSPGNAQEGVDFDERSHNSLEPRGLFDCVGFVRVPCSACVFVCFSEFGECFSRGLALFHCDCVCVCVIVHELMFMCVLTFLNFPHTNILCIIFRRHNG